MFDFIIGAFKQGGPFMYVILAVLMAGIAIIFDRFHFLMYRNRLDTTAFVNRIMEYVRTGNMNNAVELCTMSKAALPRIMRAGLEEHGQPPTKIQNALELAAMVEIPRLEKRTQYLSMIANVATLLGLLGTIIGLIQSFQAVAQADASQKAALLSSGISLAMNTTAFGLIVAVPCMIFYSYLQEKTTEIIDEINENVARIYRFLTSN